jgi:hypothetical protein
MLLVLVILNLLHRFLFSILCCTDKNSCKCLEKVKLKSNAVYMTYAQATGFVRMENYHLHNSRYFKDAYTFIPGKQQLNREPTLMVLRQIEAQTKRMANAILVPTGSMTGLAPGPSRPVQKPGYTATRAPSSVPMHAFSSVNHTAQVRDVHHGQQVMHTGEVRIHLRPPPR